MLGTKVGVGENLPVQSPRVGDNASHVDTHVTGIYSAGQYFTRASNGGIIQEKVFVNATRRQAGQADLIPPTDVNDSIGKVNSLDVVQRSLFLQ